MQERSGTMTEKIEIFLFQEKTSLLKFQAEEGFGLGLLFEIKIQTDLLRNILFHVTNVGFKGLPLDNRKGR